VGDQEPSRAHPGGALSVILDFVQPLATQNPEAFGRFVVAILCKLAEMDRGAYEYFLSGMVSRELLAAGLLVALEQAKQALSSGEINRALERVNAIEGWVHTIEYQGSRENLERLQAEDQEAALAVVGSPPTYVM
jgi:hypothetical protein